MCVPRDSVDRPMFRYFGYGSNMNLTSLRAKGIEPLASKRAVLRGWRLRFNVQHFFRHEGGVGNIEPSESPGDQVLGVLHECPDVALAALDAMEAYGHGYDRITVEVAAEVETAMGIEMGTEMGSKGLEGVEVVPAFTYVGMPQFIDDECLPSRRYLNIVVEGARRSGLASDYVEALATHPIHVPDDYPPFTPPPGDYPVYDAASLAQHPWYTALSGAVFDMSLARPLHDYLKEFFGGRDMTLFHLKRLDSSNGKESMDDIRHGRLNEAQWRYLNGYLNEYAKEYRYVGRFNYSEE